MATQYTGFYLSVSLPKLVFVESGVEGFLAEVAVVHVREPLPALNQGRTLGKPQKKFFF